MSDKIDEIRKNTLARVEKTERNYKLAFMGAAGVELLFFIAYLLLADFSDRTHVLLLLTTIAVYTLMAFSLLALGAHVSRNTLRILNAIEQSEKEDN